MGGRPWTDQVDGAVVLERDEKDEDDCPRRKGSGFGENASPRTMTFCLHRRIFLSLFSLLSSSLLFSSLSPPV